jgi:hypothetical protein
MAEVEFVISTENEIKARKVRVREAAYRNYALSTFEPCLMRACGKIKEDNGDVSSNLCCNGFQCCDVFGPPTELRREIYQFRDTLWTPPESERMTWGPTKRKLRLIKFLESCKYSSYLRSCIFIISLGSYNSGGIKLIRYSINGKQVCKDYFRTASGFTQRLFNSIVAIALGKQAASTKQIM